MMGVSKAQLNIKTTIEHKDASGSAIAQSGAFEASIRFILDGVKPTAALMIEFEACCASMRWRAFGVRIHDERPEYAVLVTTAGDSFWTAVKTATGSALMIESGDVTAAQWPETVAIALARIKRLNFR